MSDKLITAGFELLRDQGAMVASWFMADAKEAIDRHFGEGYAAKHPELVGVFMQVAGDDYNTSVRLKVAESLAENLVDSLSGLSHSLSGLSESLTDLSF